MNKSGDIFVKIIEEDVSLKQKFGIQDKRKIKELENKLEKLSNEKTELEKKISDINNQQVTNFSEQLVLLKAAIDNSRARIKRKKRTITSSRYNARISKRRNEIYPTT